MSGHSKWATIKHAKGIADAKRGQKFTKLIKEITVAAKQGGPDPNSNATLRTAILKAKAENMPKDNIERAIKKATGEGGAANYFELTYEGYAPGGVAMIVNTLTDKPNRTIGNVRSYFDKNGGSLGTTGCVSYLFDRMGVIIVEKGNLTEDDVMMAALDAGADDVIDDEDVFEIRTAPENFAAVMDAISADSSFKVISGEVTMVPQSTIELDKEASARVQKLIDVLEEDDDVQNVYHNAELVEEEEED